MSKLDDAAKEIVRALEEKTARQTSGYDTVAEVKRVSGNTAWVHIDGGVDETPVSKTIACRKGDSVRVRVSNGTAFIVGNQTAPPTDDAEALVAKAVAKVADESATEAKTTADEAQQTANAVSDVANTALSRAQEAKQIADDTEQHFWFTETGTDTGAHITEVTQEEWSDPSDPNYQNGGNLLARSNGIAVREGMKELATMSKDGFDAKTYDSSDNEVVIAHLGYGAGTNDSGGTSNAPYYDIGVRLSGSTKGNYSTVEGHDNTASGYNAHAEGSVNTASGSDSHCEGASNTASGLVAHCEGGMNTASGRYAHAEGSQTTASGSDSHCEGGMNTASGGESHCEGFRCEASGICSHAGGYRTIADQPHQTAIGKCNTANNTNNLFVVGNGTGDNARSNAFEVSDTGDVKAAGELTASNIGDKNWVAPSAVSCQSGKWYKVAEVTLDAGIWFIDCNALFPSTNTTGTRQIRVTTDTFTNGTTTIPGSVGNISVDILAGANTAQYPQSHFPVDISSQTTFRLAAYQGSGSTMSVTGRMYATRIK